MKLFKLNPWLNALVCLMRLDKPVGIGLLLWPTLWALWVASQGLPRIEHVLIFVAGTVLMRSAGCVMNDMADRRFDGHVNRTKNRPLATGAVTLQAAFVLLACLLFAALYLLLLLPKACWWLGCLGLALTIIYPFCKRFFKAPQLMLGWAFAMGVPMAFIMVQGHMPPVAWALMGTTAWWALIYDTLYAMADRDDDLKLGLHSTAITLGQYDRLWIASSTAVWLGWLGWIGHNLHLTRVFPAILGLVAVLCLYQQVQIKDREPTACFQAFLNHQWMGLLVWIGFVLG